MVKTDHKRKGKTMWNIKRFTEFSSMLDWMRANEYRYQMHEVFLNNCFAVEYKRIRRAY